MTKLNQLINALNTDKFAAVTVKNNANRQTLYKDKLSESIITEFGNAENFFDHFIISGNTNLTIEPRRKNGNSFKNSGEIFTISPEVEPVTPAIAMPEPTPKEDFSIKKKKKKKKKKTDMFGLNGGLSGADLIKLNVQADKVGDLQALNAKLESENLRLTEKNAELREEQLIKKYTHESNESRNNMFLAAIQNAPMLLAAVGVKTAPQGLSGSSELSEVQTKILDIVKTTVEPVNMVFLKVLERLKNKADGDTFENDFIEFLTQNQVI